MKLPDAVWQVIKEHLLTYKSREVPDELKEQIEEHTDIELFDGGAFVAIGKYGFVLHQRFNAIGQLYLAARALADLLQTGKDATKILAQYALTTKYQDLPKKIQHEAIRSLVNFVGVTIGSCRHPAIDICIASLRPVSSSSQASIFGRHERFDILNAAFINGVGSHVLDFDDTLRHSVGPNKWPEDPEHVRILPNRYEVLTKFADQGYLLLGASNQSAIAKGLPEEACIACFEETETIGH